MGNKNSRKSGKDSRTTASSGAKGGTVPSQKRKSEVARLSESENVNLDSFVLLTTVGKGSFGKVIQVRKKDTGEIYAMKVLKKDHVVQRNQVEHTMAERRILENIRHPFIVSLRYAFQTTQKLYMVFDFSSGALGLKRNCDLSYLTSIWPWKASMRWHFRCQIEVPDLW